MTDALQKVGEPWTAYYFRESGKYYTEGKCFISAELFRIYTVGSKVQFIDALLASNGGRLPGLSGPHTDLSMVLFSDNSDFGYPLMFPAGTLG
jgi:hypothetical protein